MAYGYGTLHIYESDETDDSVRQAVASICSAIAKLGEFEIDIKFEPTPKEIQ